MLPLLAPAVVAEIWFTVFLLRKGGGIQAWQEPAGRQASVGVA
jgi:hypothetical protein